MSSPDLSSTSLGGSALRACLYQSPRYFPDWIVQTTSFWRRTIASRDGVLLSTLYHHLRLCPSVGKVKFRTTRFCHFSWPSRPLRIPSCLDCHCGTVGLRLPGSDVDARHHKFHQHCPCSYRIGCRLPVPSKTRRSGELMTTRSNHHICLFCGWFVGGVWLLSIVVVLTTSWPPNYHGWVFVRPFSADYPRFRRRSVTFYRWRGVGGGQSRLNATT